MKTKIWNTLVIACILVQLNNCSSTDIRGDEFREKWLKENLYNEEVKQKKASPDSYKNYNVKIAVLVAEKNLEGDEWNQPLRRQKPNLKLYNLKGIYDQDPICSKENSVTLSCETLMRLEGQQILNFRLVDVRNNYYRKEYGSKYNWDEEVNHIKEVPLAQLDFLFEGQGKYLKNSGGATFVITFKEMKID
jgi:hypothetical protein